MELSGTQTSAQIKDTFSSYNYRSTQEAITSAATVVNSYSEQVNQTEYNEQFKEGKASYRDSRTLADQDAQTVVLNYQISETQTSSIARDADSSYRYKSTQETFSSGYSETVIAVEKAEVQRSVHVAEAPQTSDFYSQGQLSKQMKEVASQYSQTMAYVESGTKQLSALIIFSENTVQTEPLSYIVTGTQAQIRDETKDSLSAYRDTTRLVNQKTRTDETFHLSGQAQTSTVSKDIDSSYMYKTSHEVEVGIHSSSIEIAPSISVEQNQVQHSVYAAMPINQFDAFCQTEHILYELTSTQVKTETKTNDTDRTQLGEISHQNTAYSSGLTQMKTLSRDADSRYTYKDSSIMLTGETSSLTGMTDTKEQHSTYAEQSQMKSYAEQIIQTSMATLVSTGMQAVDTQMTKDSVSAYSEKRTLQDSQTAEQSSERVRFNLKETSATYVGSDHDSFVERGQRMYDIQEVEGESLQRSFTQDSQFTSASGQVTTENSSLFRLDRALLHQEVQTEYFADYQVATTQSTRFDAYSQGHGHQLVETASHVSHLVLDTNAQTEKKESRILDTYSSQQSHEKLVEMGITHNVQHNVVDSFSTRSTGQTKDSTASSKVSSMQIGFQTQITSPKTSDFHVSNMAEGDSMIVQNEVINLQHSVYVEQVEKCDCFTQCAGENRGSLKEAAASGVALTESSQLIISVDREQVQHAAPVSQTKIMMKEGKSNLYEKMSTKEGSSSMLAQSIFGTTQTDTEQKTAQKEAASAGFLQWLESENQTVQVMQFSKDTQYEEINIRDGNSSSNIQSIFATSQTDSEQKTAQKEAASTGFLYLLESGNQTVEVTQFSKDTQYTEIVMKEGNSFVGMTSAAIASQTDVEQKIVHKEATSTGLLHSLQSGNQTVEVSQSNKDMQYEILMPLIDISSNYSSQQAIKICQSQQETLESGTDTEDLAPLLRNQFVQVESAAVEVETMTTESSLSTIEVESSSQQFAVMKQETSEYGCQTEAEKKVSQKEAASSEFTEAFDITNQTQDVSTAIKSFQVESEVADYQDASSIYMNRKSEKLCQIVTDCEEVGTVTADLSQMTDQQSQFQAESVHASVMTVGSQITTASTQKSSTMVEANSTLLERVVAHFDRSCQMKTEVAEFAMQKGELKQVQDVAVMFKDVTSSVAVECLILTQDIAQKSQEPVFSIQQEEVANVQHAAAPITIPERPVLYDVYQETMSQKQMNLSDMFTSMIIKYQDKNVGYELNQIDKIIQIGPDTMIQDSSNEQHEVFQLEKDTKEMWNDEFEITLNDQFTQVEFRQKHFANQFEREMETYDCATNTNSNMLQVLLAEIELSQIREIILGEYSINDYQYDLSLQKVVEEGIQAEEMKQTMDLACQATATMGKETILSTVKQSEASDLRKLILQELYNFDSYLMSIRDGLVHEAGIQIGTPGCDEQTRYTSQMQMGLVRETEAMTEEKSIGDFEQQTDRPSVATELAVVLEIFGVEAIWESFRQIIDSNLLYLLRTEKGELVERPSEMDMEEGMKAEFGTMTDSGIGYQAFSSFDDDELSESPSITLDEIQAYNQKYKTGHIHEVDCQTIETRTVAKTMQTEFDYSTYPRGHKEYYQQAFSKGFVTESSTQSEEEREITESESIDHIRYEALLGKKLLSAPVVFHAGTETEQDCFREYVFDFVKKDKRLREKRENESCQTKPISKDVLMVETNEMLEWIDVDLYEIIQSGMEIMNPSKFHEEMYSSIASPDSHIIRVEQEQQVKSRPKLESSLASESNFHESIRENKDRKLQRMIIQTSRCASPEGLLDRSGIRSPSFRSRSNWMEVRVMQQLTEYDIFSMESPSNVTMEFYDIQAPRSGIASTYETALERGWIRYNLDEKLEYLFDPIASIFIPIEEAIKRGKLKSRAVPMDTNTHLYMSQKVFTSICPVRLVGYQQGGMRLTLDEAFQRNLLQLRPNESTQDLKVFCAERNAFVGVVEGISRGLLQSEPLKDYHDIPQDEDVTQRQVFMIQEVQPGGSGFSFYDPYHANELGLFDLDNGDIAMDWVGKPTVTEGSEAQVSEIINFVEACKRGWVKLNAANDPEAIIDISEGQRMRIKQEVKLLENNI
ncbi:hypothetical protein Ciccas_008675 [Cichlidogyrus casuarinus]|uniref:Uncharacterized protein n=1 Tax=Cichlidogyrus casuarinus TaxID=1844966 RepID=A0ABD2PZ80_9PLAT